MELSPFCRHFSGTLARVAVEIVSMKAPHIGRDAKKQRWVIDGFKVNGRRRRLYFKSKEEARIHLSELQARIHREGEAAWSLSHEERVDAANALELLRPRGVSLIDAARHYAAHLDAKSRSIMFAELRDRFLAAKKADNISQAHLRDLKMRLGWFAESFGQRLVSEITSREVDDWLRSLPYAPQGRANTRAVLHNAFNFAALHDYVATNPVTKTHKVKVPEREIEVLTAAQMRALLKHAPDSIIPYIAIGGFAGLRDSEVKGLKWEDVHLDRKTLYVRSRFKTGRRWVDLSDNLIRWLQPYAKAIGPVVPVYGRVASQLRHDAAQAAGFKWPKNGLRHTFGSAHAVIFQDVPRTSVQMGNTPATLIEHYRNLITPEAAAEWFGIVPPDRENVVPMESPASGSVASDAAGTAEGAG
jgi:integrase